MYGDDGFNEMVQAEAASYAAGKRARLEGKPRTANPYRPTDTLYPEWDGGWAYDENDRRPTERDACADALAVLEGAMKGEDVATDSVIGICLSILRKAVHADLPAQGRRWGPHAFRLSDTAALYLRGEGTTSPTVYLHETQGGRLTVRRLPPPRLREMVEWCYTALDVLSRAEDAPEDVLREHVFVPPSESEARYLRTGRAGSEDEPAVEP